MVYITGKLAMSWGQLAPDEKEEGAYALFKESVHIGWAANVGAAWVVVKRDDWKYDLPRSLESRDTLPPEIWDQVLDYDTDLGRKLDDILNGDVYERHHDIPRGLYACRNAFYARDRGVWLARENSYGDVFPQERVAVWRPGWEAWVHLEAWPPFVTVEAAWGPATAHIAVPAIALAACPEDVVALAALVWGGHEHD